MSFPHFKRTWRRPTTVAPFPHVWHRFTTKSRDGGQSYKVRIQDLLPEQHEEVWDMFLKYFYLEEELVTSAKQFEDEVTMISQKWSWDQCANENMSLVAVLDNDDPKPTIVGALILEVVSKDDPPYPKLPGEARAKLQNLFKLFYMSVGDEFERLKVNTCFKDYAIVIKREYQRLGIGSELFKTMELMAKTFNVPISIIVFNNNASQAMAAKLGFSVLSEVKIADYVDETGQMIIPMVDTDTVKLCYRRYS